MLRKGRRTPKQLAHNKTILTKLKGKTRIQYSDSPSTPAKRTSTIRRMIMVKLPVQMTKPTTNSNTITTIYLEIN